MSHRIFDIIPTERPTTPLLDCIESPADLRLLNEPQLPQLVQELREYLLYSVGQTGGHFGAGLGVVELTVALHFALNTPEDRIVWDVGHQTYPHKILTGRRDALNSIRQLNGLAGFPKRTESIYDTFGVGHSSTSISAALGMAMGSALEDNARQSVAVIGDGAMTAGMAFEALNHAAHANANILVILNDNNMSISKNVGGLATYFSKVWASKTYSAMRQGSKRVLEKIPQAWEFARKTEEHMKGMVSPGMLFEELGFYYVGPIHGHDTISLAHYIKNMAHIKGPKLLHIITQKGFGFKPAMDDPVGYHALNKIEPNPVSAAQKTTVDKYITTGKKQKYQDVFGQWLCDTAKLDPKLVAITPAMCEGSGMVNFAKQYPQRFHDVAIAEQHAVTFAAGMACENAKPVVAIYSTFLQRGYDQLIHDVALQNLDVTFGIDRAGLVGEDGPTHAGSFDISFLRCIPNMIIATPSDENECRQLLNTAYHFNGPAAVRYPRGTGTGANVEITDQQFAIGKGRILREGKNGCILNFGVLLTEAQVLAAKYNYTLCDMRWAKPLDEALITEQAQKHNVIITIEENAVAGGAGSGVLEYLMANALVCPVLTLGLPDINYDQGTRDELLDAAGLSMTKMQNRIESWMQQLMNNK